MACASIYSSVVGITVVVLIVFFCSGFQFVAKPSQVSSWGLGRAAVCDCGTPWTFLLPLLCVEPLVI